MAFPSMMMLTCIKHLAGYLIGRRNQREKHTGPSVMNKEPTIKKFLVFKTIYYIFGMMWCL